MKKVEILKSKKEIEEDILAHTPRIHTKYIKLQLLRLYNLGGIEVLEKYDKTNRN